jgi:protease PrsW
MDTTTEIQPPTPQIRQKAWLKDLAIAIDFYILLLAALLLTDNSNLFPNLVMSAALRFPLPT